MIRCAWSRGEIFGDSGPAMARGFGRRPVLLGSTSLNGGETSGGRFDGEWTEYGFSPDELYRPALYVAKTRISFGSCVRFKAEGHTFEDQEDEELSIMHLLVKRLMDVVVPRGRIRRLKKVEEVDHSGSWSDLTLIVVQGTLRLRLGSVGSIK
ncbi:hypothetical protein F2Q70_00028901 [Brassica cretica]|uniref:Uncharacterized protein n=1 Tax=Brassica cretica TaxID=69181 RepID=A0A8S9LI43_BRACR|nr:hypothetical protein F2Q70_00028901 [Brassica cretica]